MLPPDLGSPDLAHPPPSGALPAQIMDQGGPRLDAMKVWTVVWKGDEATGDEANAFTQWLLTTSQYWTATADFGAGRGSALGVLVLPTPAPSPLPDSIISDLVESQLASGAWPAPDAQTIFSFVLPVGALSTHKLPDLEQGCSDYIAYHSETSNTHQPYAVTLRCTAPDLSGYSFQMSHELVESASDPLPFSNPAFLSVALNAEDSDLCYPLAYEESGLIAGQMRTVSLARFWSNSSVLAAIDPCAPQLDRPYFGVGLADADLTADSNGRVESELVAFDLSGGSAPITFTTMGFDATVQPATGFLAPGGRLRVVILVSDVAGQGAVRIDAKHADGTESVYWGVVTR